MTPEQQEQWNDFACGPRCLIKFAEIRGKPITVDAFINKFSPKYPEWQVRCGITCTSDLIYIARDLNLCNKALALRNKIKIKKLFKEDPLLGILVLTDIEKGDPTQELYHCRLLINIDGDSWDLFHPDQSGADMSVSETEDTLEKQYAHFLILN